jgi:hypothetical protein
MAQATQRMPEKSEGQSQENVLLEEAAISEQGVARWQ